MISSITDPKFYDSYQDDIIRDGSPDKDLNDQMYRLLILCLDTSIEDLFLEKQYLRGDGVALSGWTGKQVIDRFSCCSCTYQRATPIFFSALYTFIA